MLNMRLRHSLYLQFGAVTVRPVHSILLLTLMHSYRAQPHVIGPSQPIVATLGDDVILPCHLDPATTAFKLTVEWTRPDLRPRFILVLRHNVELANKHPAYEGRTSLFSDELKLGNISLKLSRVRTSDEGEYRCFVPELNKDAAVQLVVGAASSPVIHMTKNSSSVLLQCNSTGWYPEPEVFWLDGEGNLLSAGPPETVRGPDDLYTVSSRVTVEKRHSNSFTCRVTQKKTNQTRETMIQVPVSDDFVEVPSASSLTSSVPAIVGAVLGIMFILAVVAGCLLWKWRRNKNKRRSLEDGAELTKGEKTVTSKSFNTGVEVIQTERETHQQQEMMRRQEQSDCVKEERQEKKKPGKEDSELLTVSISEGQREQPHNLQTDQEEKKEEETQQEKMKQPRRDVDETEETSETKTEQKDNEQQREAKLDFRQMRLQELHSKLMQQREERRRKEDQRMPRSKKREEDKIELKPQEGRKQKASKLKPKEKSKEKESEERERELERQDVVEKEEETNERGFIHVTQRNDSERVKRKQKEEEVCHDHQQQTVGKRKPEEEDTVQTEEDVKTTNQDVHMDTDGDELDEHRVCWPSSGHHHTAQTEKDRKMRNQDIDMEVDEEGAAHTEQEVISDSERLDCDSEEEPMEF